MSLLTLLRTRGESPLLNQLVSFWELEEASGTRNDAHGTNHLTDNNTVTQAAGKVGSAAQFTAANSEHLSIADNASLSMGDIDFTVGAWVYLDSKGANRALASHWTSASRGWLLYYENVSDRFVFVVGNGSNVSVGSVSATALGSPALSTWYRVIGKHSATDNTVSIQVNNGTVNSAATTGAAGDSTNAFMIGASDATPANFMNGRVDQVVVAKRLWTPTEIGWDYNSGAGRSYPDLRAYRG